MRLCVVIQLNDIYKVHADGIKEREELRTLGPIQLQLARKGIKNRCLTFLHFLGVQLARKLWDPHL